MTDAPVKPPKAAKPKRAPKPKPPKAEPPEQLDPRAYEAQGDEFKVILQPRHAEWIRRCAIAEGRTPENMAEKLIRMAYAADPTKGGLIQPGPGTTVRPEDIGKAWPGG